MDPLIKGYYALGVTHIFMILYHTIVYNEFNSISQYPAMFSNYLTLSLSILTVYFFNRRTLSVINFRRLYYVCIAYNICLYFYILF